MILKSLPTPGEFITPDNDTMQLTISDGEVGYIKICLRSASNVTWWKAIKIFGSPAGSPLGEVATEDSDLGPTCRQLRTEDFRNNGSRLELWKAKGLGVRTHIVSYSFNPTNYNGKVLNFRWVHD